MKYSEATKLVKRLSKKYSINNYDGEYGPVFELIYNHKTIAWVDKLKQFSFGRVNISTSEFDKIPYSHKLWMILAELAMTPLNERKEHKWNVIVGNDNSALSSVCWTKSSSDLPYLLCWSDSSALADDDDCIFTDSEFNNLIKYIKTLPDGKWQAKVAEHGKKEAKGE